MNLWNTKSPIKIPYIFEYITTKNFSKLQKYMALDIEGTH